MTVAELLTHVRRLDVNVWVEGDRLRLSAPTGALSLELREQLTARKNEILAFLRTAGTLGAPAKVVVTLQPEGMRPPFFAVPGHNGDVFCFVHLARHLGRDQPFHALQPPGLDGASPAIETIEGLAGRYARELRAFLPGGPYLVGGFCAGGAVAFETARQLREQGEDVRLLALMATPYPTAYGHLNRLRAATDGLPARVQRHTRMLLPAPAAHLRHLTARLGHHAKRTVVPSAADDGLLRYTRRVERATLSAIRAYCPRPFHGPVTLFAPSDEWIGSHDRPMDWKAMAGEGLETVIGPSDCDGDSLLRDPHARWLADALRARLDRAQTGADREAAAGASP